mgnify:CR=1 FL=1
MQPDTTGMVASNAVSKGDVLAVARVAGMDHVGIGEHHREDFAISAPEALRRRIRTIDARKAPAPCTDHTRPSASWPRSRTCPSWSR